jgi:recombinational DNA repair protein RecR
MGLTYSKPKGVNYDCLTCRQTQNVPNLLGKFVVLNETEYQCNSCNTIYKKEFCQICKKPKKIPNLAGSFFIIKNDYDCNCEIQSA